MKTAEVNVTARTKAYKSEIRSLRRKGFVPANMYGPGLKNHEFAINEIEFRKSFGGGAGSNLLVTLKSESPELDGKRVILKQLERDPLTWRPMHVDFLEVAVDRPLTVSVPLEFKGTPKGVKLSGGILQIIRRSVEIRALPDHIPASITVDISELDLNETLHISDIQLPPSVELTDDPKYSMVSVSEMAEEEVVVAPAAATPEAAAADGAAPAEAASGEAPAPAKAEEKK
ncbi:MAG: 50S ribosomal protein L25 [Bradymonadales bacterium]|nr:MAG: 50S ribosomal protein L25 [Bradymonadales bacterium]